MRLYDQVMEVQHAVSKEQNYDGDTMSSPENSKGKLQLPLSCDPPGPSNPPKQLVWIVSTLLIKAFSAAGTDLDAGLWQHRTHGTKSRPILSQPRRPRRCSWTNLRKHPRVNARLA